MLARGPYAESVRPRFLRDLWHTANQPPRELLMKRLIVAVVLALLAAPVVANEEDGMDRQLTTISDSWSNDHNFIAPPQ